MLDTSCEEAGLRTGGLHDGKVFLLINRTDGATVLDTAKYLCKLNTREAGTKILKRKDGTFEKQYRQNLGKLVIAYR